jgi:2-keto-4-pentenoate hydratase
MAMRGGWNTVMRRACPAIDRYRARTKRERVMTPHAIEAAARMLSESRRSRQLLDALPDALRPATLDDAHAIQEATATQMAESIAGWKVSATPDGRVARGALLRSRLYESGSRIAADAVPLLGVEAEIAFRFERDLPPRLRQYDYDEVAGAVTAIPAIEVVDSRFRGYPNAPLLDRIADCMSNGAFVYGAALPHWRNVDLETLDVELLIDGRSIVRRTGGHPTKDPLLPAVALVNDLRSGGGVRSRQVMTTGTYTGLNFAKPGQTVVARFAGFGSVSVHFEGVA